MASFFTRTKSAQDARISLELDDTVIFLHPNAVNTTLDHASMRGSVVLHLSKPRTFQSVTLTMTCWYAAQAPGSESHRTYILCEEADCLTIKTECGELSKRSVIVLAEELEYPPGRHV